MKTNNDDDVKIALITGGSAGIGRSAAIEIAKRGVNVILTYNMHQKEAEETVSVIEEYGVQGFAIFLDLAKSNSFSKFSDDVKTILNEKWQRNSFDYLVNNAGFGQMCMFEDTYLSGYYQPNDKLFDLPQTAQSGQTIQQFYCVQATANQDRLK
jgi:short-subunit dehydrogenase